VVDWSTDARTRFSDNYARWKPTGPVPTTPLLPRAAPPCAAIATSAETSAARAPVRR
ncbi:MAG: hypothetical protein JO362_04245, partial [Streptomycetaceae bacterium]|nr:hypothetical protein [Streptomycetaceae bacterium]